jgi:hypothetical protein
VALRLAVLIVVVWASSAAAQDATRLAMARLRLTTDPKVPVGCATLGTVSDNSLKDLRRKIVRLGGNTALLTFPEDLDRIQAVAFRCPASTTPAGIPPPPPGPPPPPPPR